MDDLGVDDGSANEAAEPLNVRDVLVTTFRTLGANVGSTLGLSAAVLVPSALLGLVLQVVQFQLLQSQLGNPMLAVSGVLVTALITLVIAIVSMLAMTVVMGAITHVTIETVLGRATTTADAMRVSFARILPLIGTTLITGVVETIGFFLCLVPGAVAWVWLAVAVPVCVAEKVGPIDSLQRSIELTEGHRSTVFSIGFVLAVALLTGLLCALSPALFVQFEQVRQSIETGMPITETPDPLSPLQLISTVLATVLQIVWFTIFSVMPAVLYVRLRGLRESVDAKAVASVFA